MTEKKSPIITAADRIAAKATKTDSVARGRAQAIIEQIVNPALDAARRNFEIAQTSGSRPALSNWEAAMTESMIELRELQDAVDAIDARMKEIRATIAQGLDHSDEKTFKFALGKATMAKGAERVKIFDTTLIPEKLMKLTPDTDKIGKKLRADVAVPGAELAVGDPSLRITWGE